MTESPEWRGFSEVGNNLVFYEKILNHLFEKLNADHGFDTFRDPDQIYGFPA